MKDDAVNALSDEGLAGGDFLGLVLLGVDYLIIGAVGLGGVGLGPLGVVAVHVVGQGDGDFADDDLLAAFGGSGAGAGLLGLGGGFGAAGAEQRNEHHDRHEHGKPHGGLIHNEDVRVADQRLRKTHALAIALGEVADQPVFHVGDAGGIHHLVHLGGRFLLGNAVDVGAEGEKVRYRHIHVQRRDFRQKADAGHGLLGAGDGVHSVDIKLAGGGHVVAGEHLHEGALARAVGAQQPHDLPVADGEGDVFHAQLLAVIFG